MVTKNVTLIRQKVLNRPIIIVKSRAKYTEKLFQKSFEQRFSEF